VAFSPDGKALASASFDGTIKLWEIRSAKEITSFGEQVDFYPIFSSVAFSSDGKTLAAGTWLKEPEAPHAVYLFEVATGKERNRLQGHKAWIETVAFARDGKTLASAGADQTVKVWDLTNCQELTTLKGQMRVLAVAFSPDGKTLASGGPDQAVKLWELKK